jgi:hypothetical protein
MMLLDSNGRKTKPVRAGCALQTIDELTQEKGQKGTIKMALPKVCEVAYLVSRRSARRVRGEPSVGARARPDRGGIGSLSPRQLRMVAVGGPPRAAIASLSHRPPKSSPPLPTMGKTAHEALHAPLPSGGGESTAAAVGVYHRRYPTTRAGAGGGDAARSRVSPPV